MLWGLSALPLLYLDLTQKPELQIPGSGVTGEPAILTCNIQGTCQEPKVLFPSWKGPDMSSNTTLSINSSSELSTLRCHLSLSLDNLTSRKVVKLQLVCECWWALQGLW
uniref:Siglec family like 2 n=1 Tax=Cricetulus griseus TaxID=10029 RepID=A0A8C2MW58_CRIGR